MMLLIVCSFYANAQCSQHEQRVNIGQYHFTHLSNCVSAALREVTNCEASIQSGYLSCGCRHVLIKHSPQSEACVNLYAWTERQLLIYFELTELCNFEFVQSFQVQSRHFNGRCVSSKTGYCFQITVYNMFLVNKRDNDVFSFCNLEVNLSDLLNLLW